MMNRQMQLVVLCIQSQHILEMRGSRCKLPATFSLLVVLTMIVPEMADLNTVPAGIP